MSMKSVWQWLCDETSLQQNLSVEFPRQEGQQCYRYKIHIDTCIQVLCQAWDVKASSNSETNKVINMWACQQKGLLQAYIGHKNVKAFYQENYASLLRATPVLIVQ